MSEQREAMEKKLTLPLVTLLVVKFECDNERPDPDVMLDPDVPLIRG